MDCIPVVSQIKSIVQWSTGDSEGARDTQGNFSKQCIVVSQIRSAIEHFQGDQEASQKTNEEFFESTDGFLRKVPILGHARGCISYLTGDKQVGDETMVQATKTTVGVAIIVFFLHGGFLVGSGCWILAQRVKEVDAPDPSQEANSPRMRRVGTTNAALDKFDMLDKTIDVFFPPFLDPMMASQRPRKYLNATEMMVIQCDSEDESDEEWGEFCTKRQISTISTSLVEGRRRLQEWRQSMIIPRL